LSSLSASTDAKLYIWVKSHEKSRFSFNNFKSSKKNTVLDSLYCIAVILQIWVKSKRKCRFSPHASKLSQKHSFRLQMKLYLLYDFYVITLNCLKNTVLESVYSKDLKLYVWVKSYDNCRFLLHKSKMNPKHGFTYYLR